MADRRSGGQHRFYSGGGKKKKNPGENLSGASPRPRDGKLKWKCDETISMVLIKFRPSCVQVVNTVPQIEKTKQNKKVVA